jgi:septum formation protein
MNFPQLILASVSPRRSELLEQLGVRFTAVPSRTAEQHPEHLTGRELALLNAHRKARAVAKRHPDQLVLGADTVVCLGAQVFGKPEDLESARAMLADLQGRAHQVTTGVCLVHLREHRERLFAETTEVRFRSLNPSAIAHYLERVNPLDKAGAYGIQEHGELIIEEIAGSYSNVVGLPLERLEAELANWEPPQSASPDL